MIDKVISHYKILKKLGSGGMSTVYLAEDMKLERKVALKFLKHPLSISKDDCVRFDREAKAAAKLNHPNISTIYEIDEDNGQKFIVMEYIRGITLKDAIKNNKVKRTSITNLILQIGEGIKAAHKKGIVHRDIKSSNIIIKPDGRVVITDFGLAISPECTRITSTGTSLGTVAYMSPEQVRGEDVDEQTDIWSFGVVLYEIINKKLPFSGKNIQSIMFKILNEDFSLHEISDTQGINNKLCTIIRKALLRDKSKRYKKVDEMLKDIKLLQDVSSDELTKTKLDAYYYPKSKGRMHGKRRISWFVAIASITLVFVLLMVLGKLKLHEVQNVHKWDEKIAVLTFENVGEPYDEYFGEGIAEELTSKLSTIPNLGVISRMSTKQYDTKDINIGTISEELDISYLLCGSIRWQKTGEGDNKIRVTSRLIRTSDQICQWSGVYDKDVSDIFKIQSNIAKEVVRELGFVLSEDVKADNIISSSNNLEAYSLFIQAEHEMDKMAYDYYLNAIEKLEKAVELDSSFAKAYAKLSYAYSYAFQYSRRVKFKSFIKKSREAYEKANELNPDLTETYLAESTYYYCCLKDYEEAVNSINTAIKKGLINSELFRILGLIQNRQGKYGLAYENLKLAFELNPRNFRNLDNLGMMANTLNLYDEAEKYLKLSIKLKPNRASAYAELLYNYLSNYGNTTECRKLINSIPDEILNNSTEYILFLWLSNVEFIDSNYDQAIKYLDTKRYNRETDIFALCFLKTYAADIYQHIGDHKKADSLYREVLSITEDLLRRFPDNHYALVFCGYSHAGLGNKKEAANYAEKAMMTLPIEKDHLAGSDIAWHAALIFTKVEMYERAYEVWDKVLYNSMISIHYMRIGPRNTKFREQPEFEKLLEKYM